MGVFEYESSESDSDPFLQDDLHALSQSCLPSPHSHQVYYPDDDDDDDDLQFLRRIQFKLVDTTTSDPPFSFQNSDSDDDLQALLSIQARFLHHNTHPPDFVDARDDDDDDDDDFETLVSIRRKFSDHYASSTAPDKEVLAATSLLQAIKNNRSCQKLIREKLIHLKTLMEKNNDLRKRFKTFRDYQRHCDKKVARTLSQKQCPSVHLFSTRAPNSMSKNVSPICYGPVDNAQVESTKAAFSRFPVTFRRKKWTDKERGDLRKGLLQQCQEILFQRMADDADGTVGVDNMLSTVAAHVMTPENIQVFCASGKVNWERLALVSVPGRSGAECEAKWFNYENSLINKCMWTAQEEKKLLGIILGRKGKQVPRLHDWHEIATQLGTNRTPYQCLVHFQRSLNPNILKRGWTEIEDGQLRTAVEEFGVNDWQAVASRLERSNGIQCSDRWRKYLDPAKTRVGRWVEDEDKRLKIAVNFLDKRWARVAQFVPGRTDAQCRDRWENVFDPGMRSGEWSKKEDLLLKAAVVKHGSSCWSKVASHVGSRTDNQCWRRWKTLFPRLAVEARAARIVQKVALPTNFVGRGWERPSVGAKDFSLSVPNQATEELTTSKGRKSLKRKRSTRKCGSKRSRRGESKNGAPKSKKRSSEGTKLDESADLESCKKKESAKTVERDSYECHNYWTRSRRSRDIMVKGESG